MKLAIMQPYFFPYIGYFRLVAAVDRFVFYDDVQYMKGGWINRNRLLGANGPQFFTVPLSQASYSRKINEIEVVPNDHWKHKVLKTLMQQYGGASHFGDVYPMVSSVVEMPTSLISELAKQSVRAVATYLGLPTTFVATSASYGNDALHGAQRVLDICRREGATDYYNLPGGQGLYQADEFAEADLSLHFVESALASYPQRTAEFHPGLSIIDVLMNNSPDSVALMLTARLDGLASP
jgi:hypothetical protein